MSDAGDEAGSGPAPGNGERARPAETVPDDATAFRSNVHAATVPDNDPPARETVADADAPTLPLLHGPGSGNNLPGDAPAKTLVEWLSMTDGDEPAAPRAASEMSIVSTLVAGVPAPRVTERELGTVATMDEIRSAWKAVSATRSATATTSVQVADPHNGITVSVDVALRPDEGSARHTLVEGDRSKE